MPPPLGFIDGYSNDDRRVEIKRIDNGWIVTVFNPQGRYVDPSEKMFKAMASVMPIINKAGGKGFHDGLDEGAEPWKENDESRHEKGKHQAELAQKAIENAFATAEPLRKQVETFVFIDHAKMMEFVSKTMA